MRFLILLLCSLVFYACNSVYGNEKSEVNNLFSDEQSAIKSAFFPEMELVTSFRDVEIDQAYEHSSFEKTIWPSMIDEGIQAKQNNNFSYTITTRNFQKPSEPESAVMNCEAAKIRRCATTKGGLRLSYYIEN